MSSTTRTDPVPDASPVLEARGLRRTYASGATSFEAVRGIDLEVRRGELFALLGTNGAGKTSTLEVLEGIARPSSGSVAVFGLDPVRERTQVRRRTGILLQEAGFTAELTAVETLRAWDGTLDRSVGAEAALGMVDLDDRADVRVTALSGGERRRLDLAMALMNVPELLFLDEPTTGLDPQSRHLTWDLIRSLMARGTTVVLTTHYLEEAEALADRIAIMHAGEIARSGTLAQIVADEPSRISFEATDDARALPLAGLPFLLAPPAAERGRVTLLTSDLQPTLHSLLDAAGSAGTALAGLEGRSASLEQAFLAVAGSTTQLEGVAS